MIPKILHYCWFGGGTYSKRIVQAMKTWDKYLPDYTRMLWNEKNSDLLANTFVKQAYTAERWMYVADYVRLKALYEYGGIYLDADIIVKQPFEPLLTGNAFTGFGGDNYEISASTLCFSPKHPFIKEMISLYDSIPFIKNDGSFDTTSLNIRMSEILHADGLNCKGLEQTVSGVTVYPMTYFCPKSFLPDKVKDCVSKKTYCIHEWDAQWLKRERSILVRTARKLRLGKLKDKLFNKASGR